MTPAQREALILSLEPKVSYLAKRQHRALPSNVTLDEMISAAWLGAIQAVDRWDGARNLFSYAESKIRSAILDYLRSLDPLSRDHRQAVKRGDAPRCVICSMEPFTADNGTSDCPVGIIGVLEDSRAIADHKALEARLTVESILARAQLNPRAAGVLARCMGDEKQKVIGVSLGLRESSISQIRTRAIQKLRAAA